MRARRADKIQQKREADGIIFVPWYARVNEPDGIFQCRARFVSVTMILRDKSKIVVDSLGDRVEIKTLRRVRFLEHEKRKAFLRSVSQPFVHRKTIAFRL